MWVGRRDGLRSRRRSDLRDSWEPPDAPHTVPHSFQDTFKCYVMLCTGQRVKSDHRLAVAHAWAPLGWGSTPGARVLNLV